MKERGITRDDVKLSVRNPTYEKRCGWSTKSFRELETIGGNIKKTLVVIWCWNKNQLIIQTAYYDFIKFK